MHICIPYVCIYNNKIIIKYFHLGTCQSGVSFYSKASATDTAHSSMECSNAGTCDYQTGRCNCLPGYEGIACQRLMNCGSQKNKCNGHGKCMPISDIPKVEYYHFNTKVLIKW